MTPDQHDELANAISTENDNNTLVAKGLDPDTMTPEQRNIALNDLQPIIHSPLDDLFGALGTIGGGLIGSLGLAFGRKREDEITGEATVRDVKIDGDKPPVPDSLIDPIALAIPDAPSEPERRPEPQVYPALERGEGGLQSLDGRDYKTIKSDLLLNMPTN